MQEPPRNIRINLKAATLIVAVVVAVVVVAAAAALAGVPHSQDSAHADDPWTALGLPAGVGTHYAYGDADRYPSPLQQQRDGVLLGAISCNVPNELYVKDASVPVCITAHAYEHLLAYGLELVPYDAYAAGQLDVITIGTIAPLTGGAAGYGQEILAASNLSVSDFNALLEERGETWRLSMEYLDSMTDGKAQTDSIVAFNEQGIKIINGPAIEIFDPDAMDYANDNGMLLLSCCSSTLSYGIAGDAMLRMSADQSNAGRVLAELMHDEKMTVLVTVGRDASWITDILDSAAGRFAELGGTVAGPSVLYDVSGEFDVSTIQRLAGVVADAEPVGGQEIGVLFVGFEESYDFLELASTHDVLGQARWFGADINTILHDNPAGLEFAESVDFMSVQPKVAANDINARVSEQVSASLGRTSDVYSLLAYDAVQLIGRAILDIQEDSAGVVAEAIPRVAKDYAGASGSISFNDAGDRDTMTYAAWIVEDGTWVVEEFLTPDDVMLEPEPDTWNQQGSEVVADSAPSPGASAPSLGSGTPYSGAPSLRTEALSEDSALGFAVGGAQDIDNFRANIDAGFLPLHTDVTHEGLFYDYYFDTGAAQECEELFCPSYLTAVSADPFSGANQYYLSVGLNSNLKEADFERKNLHLVIVLDVSSSMSSPFDQYYYDSQGNPVSRDTTDDDFTKSKMKVANESVVGLLDHLTDDDRLGVVLFDSTAHVAKPLESMGGTDRERLAQNILGIYADGGTNMESGITAGTSLFDDVLESDQAGYENRIIFLTDAMPNTGSTGKNQLFNLIEWNAEKKIYTTVIGIGVDFNTELIESVPDVRGANYYSVHSPSEFLERMSDEFEFMVTPLVFDLSLRLDADGYEVLDVYGVPESDSFTGDLIHVNTLFPSRVQDGETRGGIILVKLAKESDAGRLELRASYLDRDGHASSSTAVVAVSDEEHYQNSGIQKGILLSRYADLMKTWAYDERSSHAGTPYGSDYLYSDGLHVPKRVGVSLGQWERQSVPLTVSSDYASAIAEFAAHFSQEAESIGDPELLQEAALMSTLLYENLQNGTDTWVPRP